MMAISTGTGYLIASSVVVYVVALTIFLMSLMDRVDKILEELKLWKENRLKKALKR